MDVYTALILVCCIIFFLSLATNKVELLVNFVFRMCIGAVVIYLVNIGFSYMGMSGGVNINPVTLGVSGCLGVQGVVMLYAMGIYFQL